MNFSVMAPFSVSVLGAITIILLLVKSKSLSSRFLALSLLASNYSVLLVFLYESKYLFIFPHFFRTAPVLAYITAPAFYLYIAFSLNKTKKLSRKHGIHLLAAFLYFIDYFPVFILSAKEKRKLIQNLLAHHATILQYDEGWLFPANFHYAAWAIFSMGYIVAAIVLLMRNNRAPLSASLTQNNPHQWLNIITGIYALYVIVCMYNVFLSTGTAMWNLELASVALIVFATCIALFFCPHVLYDGVFVAEKNDILLKKEKQPAIKMPEDTGGKIEQLLTGYLDKKKFLRKNLTLKEMAEELAVQPYLLSAYINRVHQMRFNDFINKHRVEYIKQELSKNRHLILTLEAIAENAGYNNRTTFLASFKKFAGMTPTEFITRNEKIRSRASAEQ